MRNTLLLNLYSLAFGFPAPILFALLLNELYGTAVKRVAQTVTYFPYFLSSTIIAGLVVQLVGPQGMVNDLLGGLFNMAPVRFLEQPGLFRPIYVAANIWKGLGFGAIIYLAAMAGIDPDQYEAALMDGAGRLRRLWHVTIPALVPTMVVLFLLSLGSIMSVGIELVLLLYNPLTYETADVIDTFDHTHIAENRIPTKSVQTATLMVNVLPIMLLYPLLQRYFVKGILIGAIKG